MIKNCVPGLVHIEQEKRKSFGRIRVEILCKFIYA